MPIRFACTHCGQKLSVGSHKAGQKANCPRCKQTVRVPGEVSKPSRALAQSMLIIAGEPKEAPAAEFGHPESAPADHLAEEPFAPPLAGESDPPFETSPLETSELVFDTSSPSAGDKSDPDVVARTDYNLVSFPRYVLYAQAGVIAGTAIICFTLGALMGSAFFHATGGTAAAKPCTVSGFVQVTEGVTRKGDDGAVVIALPHNVETVPERSPIEGLRPTDSAPEPTHRGLLLLQSHGGSFAKADKTGRYQLRLPRPGKYSLFVISKAKTAREGEVDAIHMLKMATFFENPTQLIGTQKCKVFSDEKFLADRKFDVSFE
jgi:hypothetical protein